ncbi:MAG: CDP-diacylglycerol--glycerol-3-phosphate 3-phosphatidyltransferase [Gammaproteobacteria bacterium]|nr:CDP-diacylglycerol--glycerol-3-phosphate 3-phosphatidyltransferase [Gammaproteobacteria bacterium]MCW8922693.1 CDP-diacylglycerol--glycerol-3-phosphate 3-phosphatidyltransferase [Gammaproteobacteria bacterium]
MNINIPNTLTLFRMGIIPVFILAFYWPHPEAHVIATSIFFIAGISDWFDGYLARKLNQQSALGAFLDPLADKLMVVVALCLLIAEYPDNNWLLFSAIIILAREIIISSLREWMATQGKDNIVMVSFAGKAKTFAQLWALGFLIYGKDLFDLPIFTIGIVLIVWAAILTLYSMMTYLISAWSTIKNAG